MNRQEMEYFARKYGVTLIIGLCVVLFLAPLLLRLVQGSPITPGAQSYHYLRQATLVEQGVFGTDPLHQEAFAPNPYVLLLAAMQLFGVPWLLPVLLAMLFAVLLYYYLMRITSARALVLLAVVTVLLSPSMSILATHHTTTLLAMVLVLVALLWFQRHPIMACIALGLAVITAPVLGLLAAGLLLLIFLRRAQYHEVIGILLAAAAGFVWFVPWTGAGPQIAELLRPAFSAQLFFELGNTAGISIFLLVMAIYGVVARFGKNNDLLLYALLLLLLAFFIPAVTPVAVVALSLFAARGIYALLTAQWELQLLQSSLLVLIACVGLFLFITTARERVAETPDADFAHTMTTLRNQYREGAVLTAPEYAPMIEYYTGRRATVDRSTPGAVVSDLFYSQKPSVVYPYLTRSQTSYVLITDDMRNSMFRRSDEGILFLLQNTEQFVRIEESASGTLWFFIRPQ